MNTTEKNIISICVNALLSLVMGILFALPCYFYFVGKPIYWSIIIGCAYTLFWYFCVLRKLGDDAESQPKTFGLSIIMSVIPILSLFFANHQFGFLYHLLVLFLTLVVVPIGLRDSIDEIDDNHPEEIYVFFVVLLSLLIGTIVALLLYFMYASIGAGLSFLLGLCYVLFWAFTLQGLSIASQFKIVGLTIAISSIPILSLYISDTIVYHVIVGLLVILLPIFISKKMKEEA